ncbi:ABC transporter ATP-binding protein [Planctomyces sp. SH-PL14]|uniref:ABC transporter ATP-binding protein n=1 Tax=Planctomyces sp. SH-PL14 TaxID=1632864 RepID=UPI00078D7838|nr:ABC transporter ATP-binding protein [Planctomyces sp. SH-PL14]AMV21482.1 putative ABC transporter ATP-binding protein [Planctomyces sp. SH-PL14]
MTTAAGTTAEPNAPEISNWQMLRRLVRLGYEYRWGALLMVVMHVLLVGLGIATLGLTGLGIDYIRHVVQPDSRAPAWPFGIAPPADWTPRTVVAILSLLILVAALANALVRFLAAIATANLTQTILVALRAGVFEKLQRLSFHFYDSGESSSIINRAAGDVNAVRSFVDAVLVKIVTVALTLAVYLVYMLRVHVGLTFWCLISSPLLWIGAVLFSRLVQPSYRRASELGDAMVRTLVESLTGIQVIKGFAREPEEIAKFEAATRRIRDQKESIFWQVSTYQPIMGLLTQVNMLVLIGYGGILVVRGEVQLGAGLFVFANLLHEFANQVSQIVNIANTIQSSLVGAQRVFEVLDAPVQIQSPPGAVRLPRARGIVEFAGVTFGYRPGQPVLHDVSFRGEPGERVGICGPTGSGKTTLLSLIMRFYDVDAGRVMIDGTDVRQLDVDDLRRNMGIVFQDSFLFSHTVAANIAFGHPEATLEQIERAARIALAAEFVEALPQRYDTVVGEHGSNLSGGQRQRLAIARALLPDPPILLLDDATASVDPETEHEIRAALDAAMERRTTLVVSNRVSTLRKTDRILVIEDGRITAVGTHHDLMASSPYFRQLTDLQYTDALEEVGTP